MSFADNLVYLAPALRHHAGRACRAVKRVAPDRQQNGKPARTTLKWTSCCNYATCFHTSLDDLMRGSVHVVKENDTERYDEHMNRFDLSIAAGAACILVGGSERAV